MEPFNRRFLIRAPPDTQNSFPVSLGQGSGLYLFALELVERFSLLVSPLKWPWELYADSVKSFSNFNVRFRTRVTPLRKVFVPLKERAKRRVAVVVTQCVCRSCPQT